MPERIQIRRTKGWRKPEGAIIVARPSPWGNPFPIDGSWAMWTAVGLGFMGDKAGRRQAAVVLHKAWITGANEIPRQPIRTNGGALEFGDGSVVSLGDHCANIALVAAGMYDGPTVRERPDLEPLRGHDLACWCDLSVPCHADVLLELANQ
jgi:hypothetical protein